MLMQAFAPIGGQTAGLANAIVVATSTTPATVPLHAGGLTTSVAYAPSIQIANVSSGWLWLNFGPAGLTAAAIPVATNIPIIGVPPNAIVVYNTDPGVTTIAYVLTAGTGIMIINSGEGV